MHFGVFHERATLWIDCEKGSEMPLGPRGPIDVNGHVALAKMANNEQTVPVSFIEI